MNYDTVILELLTRIQTLEKEVALLRQAIGGEALPKDGSAKITTSDIRSYIEEQKALARAEGQPELTLKANDIHKALQLKNRVPMVCNAMRQCMNEGDTVLYDTPSGHSSTLEIRYQLTSRAI